MQRPRLSQCIFALLMLVAACQVSARDPLAVRPESVGLSSTRLQRISVNAQKLVEQDRLAGAVTLVARRGNVAQFEAVGWQDKEQKIKMQPDTIFRIASISKPITSVAVLMLYEEGHFKLDAETFYFFRARQAGGIGEYSSWSPWHQVVRTDEVLR